MGGIPPMKLLPYDSPNLVFGAFQQKIIPSVSSLFLSPFGEINEK
jgi:hypothetical protein